MIAPRDITLYLNIFWAALRTSKPTMTAKKKKLQRCLAIDRPCMFHGAPLIVVKSIVSQCDKCHIDRYRPAAVQCNAMQGCGAWWSKAKKGEESASDWVVDYRRPFGAQRKLRICVYVLLLLQGIYSLSWCLYSTRESRERPIDCSCFGLNLSRESYILIRQKESEKETKTTTAAAARL